MKRGHVFLFISAILLSFFLYQEMRVTAQRCQSDNDKIFRISSISNAHAEVWNGSGNYGYEICFSNIFRGSQSGQNPRQCINNNVVLKLSGNTNAHVAGPASNVQGYLNVCFGNLTCFLQDPNKNCNDSRPGGGPPDNSYCMIATISAQDNAHIAIGRYYGYTICCKSTLSSQTCKCNYNGICEPQNGESALNCPDCSAVCGDGIVEPPEQCDGTNLSNQNCSSLGFTGAGNLACYPSGHPNQCTFNTTGCTNQPAIPQCRDGIDNDNDNTCDHNGCTISDRTLQPDLECIGDPEKDSEKRCNNGILELGEQCDCEGRECRPEQLGNKDCTTAPPPQGVTGYKGGVLNCTSACTYNFSRCVPFAGFCRDNEPFEFYSGGAWLTPSSCQDYNLVYPLNPDVGNQRNHTMRRDLCRNDCVPGASDPVNNGYGGMTLLAWGCEFDEKNNDQINYNGECFFYFNSTTNPSTICRLDYEVLQNCGPDNPFRKVRVTPKAITPGGDDSDCDAGCGGGQNCETQIMCPRVIELPAISIVGLILAAVLIALIYLITRKK